MKDNKYFIIDKMSVLYYNVVDLYGMYNLQ